MNEEKLTLTISSSPHIRSQMTTQKIMINVVIALLPALIVAGYVFGIYAIVLTGICVASCVLTEGIIQKLTKQEVTINDWSAVVTGVLLAFNLPIAAPWWMAVIGSAFAIAVVKQVFGGLGHNFMNPALTARAFLLASWPIHMTGTAFIPQGLDAVATATPLAILKEGSAAMLPSNLDMFLGMNGVYGAIGEISALALLIGGIYLIARKIISWRIPFFYLLTVALISLCMGLDPIFMLCSGGLMLGAFFMATDYVTSPNTPLGQILFAIGCGVLTMIIRHFGSYPEGVSYSILLMNIVTPLIDRLMDSVIIPKVFRREKGSVKNG